MEQMSHVLCSDATEWALSMPDKSVDHIITDYEYGTYFPFHEFKRICKGTILTFCSEKDNPMEGFYDEKAYWIKTPSTKNTQKRLSRFVEEIHIYHQPEYPVFNGSKKTGLHWSQYTGVYTDLVEISGWYWKKPLSLMERLVLIFTNPGDLVVDPYCGSGTTLQALKKHERRFVGIDKDQTWVDYCKESDELLWR